MYVLRFALLYYKKNNILFKRQFGSLNNHSTNHALLSLVELKKYLDINYFVCDILIDLQNEFDIVNSNILLAKPEHYGVRKRVNKQITSHNLF